MICRAIISSLFVATFFSVTAQVNIDSGLVAYWPLNGDANDLSGNGNHGTVYDAAQTSDRFGNPGAAYYFDGIDDYIDFGNDESLKPELPFSFSLWVKRGDNIHNPFFTTNFHADKYYGVFAGIFAEDSYQVGIGYGDGGGIGPAFRRSKYGNTATVAGTWYHLVGIMRGPADMDIYLGGVNDGGFYTGTGGILTYDDGSANLGRNDSNNTGPELYFNGSIDEFRIYDRVLTEAEIAVLFDEVPVEPAVSGSMTARDNPIEIPPGGGSFDYRINFTNNTDIPQNIDFWTVAQPVGGPAGPPIVGPRNKTFPASATLTRGFTQLLPNSSPGDFYYILFLGTYPDTIIDSDTLDILKLAEASFVTKSSRQSLIPDVPALRQNYPNPFNPTTNFGYQISDFGLVEINIYDIQGRQVKTVVSQPMNAGTYSASWDGTNDTGQQVSSGIYFYQLTVTEQVNPQSMIRKMLLSR